MSSHSDGRADDSSSMPLAVADFKCSCEKHQHLREKKHTIFISYRVAADKVFALEFAEYLEAVLDCKVFLDQRCLNTGQEWKDEGFLQALFSESIVLIILLLSNEGMKQYQTAHVIPDNCFVELELSLQKKNEGKAAIFPVFIGEGDVFSAIPSRCMLPELDEHKNPVKPCHASSRRTLSVKGILDQLLDIQIRHAPSGEKIISPSTSTEYRPNPGGLKALVEAILLSPAADMLRAPAYKAAVFRSTEPDYSWTCNPAIHPNNARHDVAAVCCVDVVKDMDVKHDVLQIASDNKLLVLQDHGRRGCCLSRSNGKETIDQHVSALGMCRVVVVILSPEAIGKVKSANTQSCDLLLLLEYVMLGCMDNTMCAIPILMPSLEDVLQAIAASNLPSDLPFHKLSQKQQRVNAIVDYFVRLPSARSGFNSYYVQEELFSMLRHGALLQLHVEFYRAWLLDQLKQNLDQLKKDVSLPTYATVPGSVVICNISHNLSIYDDSASAARSFRNDVVDYLSSSLATLLELLLTGLGFRVVRFEDPNCNDATVKQAAALVVICSAELRSALESTLVPSNECEDACKNLLADHLDVASGVFSDELLAYLGVGADSSPIELLRQRDNSLSDSQLESLANKLTDQHYLGLKARYSRALSGKVSAFCLRLEVQHGLAKGIAVLANDALCGSFSPDCGGWGCAVTSAGLCVARRVPSKYLSLESLESELACKSPKLQAELTKLLNLSLVDLQCLAAKVRSVQLQWEETAPKQVTVNVDSASVVLETQPRRASASTTATVLANSAASSEKLAHFALEAAVISMFGAFKNAITFAPTTLQYFDQDQQRDLQASLRGVDRLIISFRQHEQRKLPSPDTGRDAIGVPSAQAANCMFRVHQTVWQTLHGFLEIHGSRIAAFKLQMADGDRDSGGGAGGGNLFDTAAKVIETFMMPLISLHRQCFIGYEHSIRALQQLSCYMSKYLEAVRCRNGKDQLPMQKLRGKLIDYLCPEPKEEPVLDMAKELMDCIRQAQRYPAAHRPALLLCGDPGSGKSVLVEECACTLFDLFQDTADERALLPLIIDLKSMSNPVGGLLSDFFSDLQVGVKISDLKNMHILFILEGYDELSINDKNLLTANNFKDWPNAVTLITCRAEFFRSNSNFRSLFSPDGSKKSTRLKLLMLSPLTDSQVQSYLQSKFVPQGQSELQGEVALREHLQFHLNCASVEQLLSQHGMTGLLHVPLMVTIFAKVLDQRSDMLNDGMHVSRASLYTAFLELFIQRQRDENLGLAELVSVADCMRGCDDLAWRFFQEDRRSWQYTPAAVGRDDEQIDVLDVSPQRRVPIARFLNYKDHQHPEINAFLKLAPINIRKGVFGREVFEFIHASFFEYFVARHIFREALTHLDSAYERPLALNGIILSFLTCLGQQSLSRYRPVVRFLADHISTNFDIWRLLKIACRLGSKKLAEDDTADSDRDWLSRAVANALLILHAWHPSFAGMDFCSLQLLGKVEWLLPGAILHHTLFTGAQFGGRGGFPGGTLVDVDFSGIKVEKLVLDRRRSLCSEADANGRMVDFSRALIQPSADESQFAVCLTGRGLGIFDDIIESVVAHWVCPQQHAIQAIVWLPHQPGSTQQKRLAVAMMTTSGICVVLLRLLEGSLAKLEEIDRTKDCPSLMPATDELLSLQGIYCPDSHSIFNGVQLALSSGPSSEYCILVLVNVFKKSEREHGPGSGFRAVHIVYDAVTGRLAEMVAMERPVTGSRVLGLCSLPELVESGTAPSPHLVSLLSSAGAHSKVAWTRLLPGRLPTEQQLHGFHSHTTNAPNSHFAETTERRIALSQRGDTLLIVNRSCPIKAQHEETIEQLCVLTAVVLSPDDNIIPLNVPGYTANLNLNPTSDSTLRSADTIVSSTQVLLLHEESGVSTVLDSKSCTANWPLLLPPTPPQVTDAGVRVSLGFLPDQVLPLPLFHVHNQPPPGYERAQCGAIDLSHGSHSCSTRAELCSSPTGSTFVVNYGAKFDEIYLSLELATPLVPAAHRESILQAWDRHESSSVLLNTGTNLTSLTVPHLELSLERDVQSEALMIPIPLPAIDSPDCDRAVCAQFLLATQAAAVKMDIVLDGKMVQPKLRVSCIGSIPTPLLPVLVPLTASPERTDLVTLTLNDTQHSLTAVMKPTDYHLLDEHLRTAAKSIKHTLPDALNPSPSPVSLKASMPVICVDFESQPKIWQSVSVHTDYHSRSGLHVIISSSVHGELLAKHAVITHSFATHVESTSEGPILFATWQTSFDQLLDQQQYDVDLGQTASVADMQGASSEQAICDDHTQHNGKETVLHEAQREPAQPQPTTPRQISIRCRWLDSTVNVEPTAWEQQLQVIFSPKPTAAEFTVELPDSSGAWLPHTLHANQQLSFAPAQYRDAPMPGINAQYPTFECSTVQWSHAQAGDVTVLVSIKDTFGCRYAAMSEASLATLQADFAFLNSSPIPCIDFSIDSKTANRPLQLTLTPGSATMPPSIHVTSSTLNAWYVVTEDMDFFSKTDGSFILSGADLTLRVEPESRKLLSDAMLAARLKARQWFHERGLQALAEQVSIVRDKVECILVNVRNLHQPQRSEGIAIFQRLAGRFPLWCNLSVQESASEGAKGVFHGHPILENGLCSTIMERVTFKSNDSKLADFINKRIRAKAGSTQQRTGKPGYDYVRRDTKVMVDHMTPDKGQRPIFSVEVSDFQQDCFTLVLRNYTGSPKSVEEPDCHDLVIDQPTQMGEISGARWCQVAKHARLRVCCAPDNALLSKSDNGNSVILCLQYDGVSLLITLSPRLMCSAMHCLALCPDIDPSGCPDLVAVSSPAPIPPALAGTSAGIQVLGLLLTEQSARVVDLEKGSDVCPKLLFTCPVLSLQGEPIPPKQTSAVSQAPKFVPQGVHFNGTQFLIPVVASNSSRWYITWPHGCMRPPAPISSSPWVESVGSWTLELSSIIDGNARIRRLRLGGGTSEPLPITFHLPGTYLCSRVWSAGEQSESWLIVVHLTTADTLQVSILQLTARTDKSGSIRGSILQPALTVPMTPGHFLPSATIRLGPVPDKPGIDCTIELTQSEGLYATRLHKYFVNVMEHLRSPLQLGPLYSARRLSNTLTIYDRGTANEVLTIRHSDNSAACSDVYWRKDDNDEFIISFAGKLYVVQPSAANVMECTTGGPEDRYWPALAEKKVVQQRKGALHLHSVDDPHSVDGIELLGSSTAGEPICFSTDWIVAADKADTHFNCWSVRNGKSNKKPSVHQTKGRVMALAVSGDNVFVTTDRAECFAMQLLDHEESASSEGHCHEVCRVALLPFHDYLYLVSIDCGSQSSNKSGRGTSVRPRALVWRRLKTQAEVREFAGSMSKLLSAESLQPDKDALRRDEEALRRCVQTQMMLVKTIELEPFPTGTCPNVRVTATHIFIDHPLGLSYVWNPQRSLELPRVELLPTASRTETCASDNAVSYNAASLPDPPFVCKHVNGGKWTWEKGSLNIKYTPATLLSSTVSDGPGAAVGVRSESLEDPQWASTAEEPYIPRAIFRFHNPVPHGASITLSTQTSPPRCRLTADCGDETLTELAVSPDVAKTNLAQAKFFITLDHVCVLWSSNLLQIWPRGPLASNSGPGALGTSQLRAPIFTFSYGRTGPKQYFLASCDALGLESQSGSCAVLALTESSISIHVQHADKPTAEELLWEQLPEATRVLLSEHEGGAVSLCNGILSVNIETTSIKDMNTVDGKLVSTITMHQLLTTSCQDLPAATHAAATPSISPRGSVPLMRASAFGSQVFVKDCSAWFQRDGLVGWQHWSPGVPLLAPDTGLSPDQLTSIMDVLLLPPRSSAAAQNPSFALLSEKCSLEVDFAKNPVRPVKSILHHSFSKAEQERMHIVGATLCPISSPAKSGSLQRVLVLVLLPNSKSPASMTLYCRDLITTQIWFKFGLRDLTSPFSQMACQTFPLTGSIVLYEKLDPSHSLPIRSRLWIVELGSAPQHVEADRHGQSDPDCPINVAFSFDVAIRCIAWVTGDHFQVSFCGLNVVLDCFRGTSDRVWAFSDASSLQTKDHIHYELLAHFGPSAEQPNSSLELKSPSGRWQVVHRPTESPCYYLSRTGPPIRDVALPADAAELTRITWSSDERLALLITSKSAVYLVHVEDGNILHHTVHCLFAYLVSTSLFAPCAPVCGYLMLATEPETPGGPPGPVRCLAITLPSTEAVCQLGPTVRVFAHEGSPPLWVTRKPGSNRGELMMLCPPRPCPSPLSPSQTPWSSPTKQSPAFSRSPSTGAAMPSPPQTKSPLGLSQSPPTCAAVTHSSRAPRITVGGRLDGCYLKAMSPSKALMAMAMDQHVAVTTCRVFQANANPGTALADPVFAPLQIELVHALQWSPDSRYLAVIHAGGTHILDVTSAKEPLRVCVADTTVRFLGNNPLVHPDSPTDAWQCWLSDCRFVLFSTVPGRAWPRLRVLDAQLGVCLWQIVHYTDKSFAGIAANSKHSGVLLLPQQSIPSSEVIEVLLPADVEICDGPGLLNLSDTGDLIDACMSADQGSICTLASNGSARVYSREARAYTAAFHFPSSTRLDGTTSFGEGAGDWWVFFNCLCSCAVHARAACSCMGRVWAWQSESTIVSVRVSADHLRKWFVQRSETFGGFHASVDLRKQLIQSMLCTVGREGKEVQARGMLTRLYLAEPAKCEVRRVVPSPTPPAVRPTSVSSDPCFTTDNKNRIVVLRALLFSAPTQATSPSPNTTSCLTEPGASTDGSASVSRVSSQAVEPIEQLWALPPTLHLVDNQGEPLRWSEFSVQSYDADKRVLFVAGESRAFCWDLSEQRAQVTPSLQKQPETTFGGRGMTNNFFNRPAQVGREVEVKDDTVLVVHFNGESGPSQAELVGHVDSIRDWAWYDNGSERIVVTGGADKTVKMWVHARLNSDATTAKKDVFLLYKSLQHIPPGLVEHNVTGLSPERSESTDRTESAAAEPVTSSWLTSLSFIILKEAYAMFA